MGNGSVCEIRIVYKTLTTKTEEIKGPIFCINPFNQYVFV